MNLLPWSWSFYSFSDIFMFSPCFLSSSSLHFVLVLVHVRVFLLSTWGYSNSYYLLLFAASTSAPAVYHRFYFITLYSLPAIWKIIHVFQNHSLSVSSFVFCTKLHFFQQLQYKPVIVNKSDVIHRMLTKVFPWKTLVDTLLYPTPFFSSFCLKLFIGFFSAESHIWDGR